MKHNSGDFVLREINKEANGPGRKRLLRTPSLVSLKSLIAPNRSPPSSSGVAISQPTLAESSREKMRSKVRHSPSMLSIHAQGAELVSTYEKSQLDRLLQYSSQKAPESYYTPRSDRLTVQYSLGHIPPAALLQTLHIHALLESNDAIARITDVHIVNTAGNCVEEYSCVFEMPVLGQPLSEVKFESKHEPVHVLLELTKALAAAEQSVQFEHRNLHPGNVMIDRDPHSGSISKVTIVSCSLARVSQISKEALYTPLDHPGFYDAHTPVLSLMRKVVKNPAHFTPATNVLWLVYLARYMYNLKPSRKLRSMYEALSPKWHQRKGVCSAREAWERMSPR